MLDLCPDAVTDPTVADTQHSLLLLPQEEDLDLGAVSADVDRLPDHKRRRKIAEAVALNPTSAHCTARTHSLTHSHLRTHSFTRSLIHSLTPSLTHSSSLIASLPKDEIHMWGYPVL